MNPLPCSPTGPKWREMPVSRNYLYIIFRIPSNRALLQVPSQSSRRERCSIFIALLLSLNVFSNRNTLPPTQGSPNGPLQRETPVSRSFFYTFPSKSLVNEPLPPCSPSGSLWREKLHPQRQWFMHSFISLRVPNKEPSHKKWGKYLVTVHGAPHGQKAYIQWGEASFPKGIIYNTAISTPVPCSPRHDTFHLGLGWPEPHYPACVIATPIRVYPPQLLTTSHMTQGRVEYESTIPWGKDEGLDLWEV